MTNKKALARPTPAVSLQPNSAVVPVQLKKYSPNTASSTVAVQHSEYVEVSTMWFLLYISFQLSIITRISSLLCPSWDQMVFLLHNGGRNCSYLAAVALQGQSSQSPSLSLCFLATLCWQCMHAGEHGVV